jgi:virginiamycin B lyase
MTTGGSFTEYSTSGGGNLGIVSGVDGNLWFTENSGSAIGTITTSGTLTVYPIPTLTSSPWFITSGPDGDLWFTENSTGQLGRVTTSGVFMEYPIPPVSGQNAHPIGIVTGPDGKLWIGDSSVGVNSFGTVSSTYSQSIVGGDGAGAMTTGTSSVTHSSTGNTITFTYTNTTGGTSNGSVTLEVPAGWDAPTTSGTANGYSVASTGSLSVSGQVITVTGVTLANNGSFTITYGSTGGGGAGATAPSGTGSQTWHVQEYSTSGGTLADINVPPSITVS